VRRRAVFSKLTEVMEQSVRSFREDAISSLRVGIEVDGPAKYREYICSELRIHTYITYIHHTYILIGWDGDGGDMIIDIMKYGS